jgi:hypothetical protein
LENEVFENAASSAAAAERAMNPRSTLIGYVASAIGDACRPVGCRLVYDETNMASECQCRSDIIDLDQGRRND